MKWQVDGRRRLRKDNHSVHLPDNSIKTSTHDVISADGSANLVSIDLFQKGCLFMKVELTVDVCLRGEMVSLP